MENTCQEMEMAAINNQKGECIPKRAVQQAEEGRVLDLLASMIQVSCQRIVLDEFSNGEDEGVQAQGRTPAIPGIIGFFREKTRLYLEWLGCGPEPEHLHLRHC